MSKGKSIFFMVIGVCLILLGVYLFSNAPDSAQRKVALAARCTETTRTYVSQVGSRHKSGNRYYYHVNLSYKVNGKTYDAGSDESTNKPKIGDKWNWVNYNPDNPSEYYAGTVGNVEYETQETQAASIFAMFAGLIMGGMGLACLHQSNNPSSRSTKNTRQPRIGKDRRLQY